MLSASVLVLAAAATWVARAADPSTLWHIVHDRCVPRAIQAAVPEPCVEVNLAGGSAVLKDITGATQFLLIPTARVSGIEDPAILASEAPNFWQDAWQARHYVEQNAGHPLARDVLSLAINSAYGRSQDQLHIHIDCIRADVRNALQANQAAIGPRWAEFPQRLVGHRYRAMRIERPGLGTIDPFRLLVQDVGQEAMGKHTLVLVGVSFRDTGPGFVLLDDHVDLAVGDQAHGEALQDHDCALAR